MQLVESDDLQATVTTERTEPWGRAADTEHLKLGSSGFAIDYESAKELLEGAEKDDEPAQDAEEPTESPVDPAELLPEDMTLRATDPIDVFQLDEADEPTSVRIATAEVQDGAPRSR